MKKITKRIIGILFAFLLLAGMFVISCDRPATQPPHHDPSELDLLDKLTPDNGRERSILLVDSNGTNEPN